MPTFQKCPEDVIKLAGAVMCEFPEHKPTLDARVKIDFVFAYADRGDDGEPKNNAITYRGRRALGLCRKIKLKDRVLGHGDVEITLDGDWWQKVDEAEQRALLDHELYHIEVEVDSNHKAITDDITRPIIHMRKHDVEVGWFSLIASRHGMHSIERQDSAAIMVRFGQMFWPEIAGANS